MDWRRIRATGFAALAAALLMASNGTAADLGAVTNLPIPRFVSMKASSANIRRGPSLTHRVDWVFQHQGMPLIVTGEYGHWRRVRDRDGLGGWIHYALLSGTRTVIVDEDMAEIHARPEPNAALRARAERGVIARLDECEAGWCKISTSGERGWMKEDALWGVDLDQSRAQTGIDDDAVVATDSSAEAPQN